ncbi:zinc metalloproteinase nas-7 [Stylonychia lemnae]|uniref:Zinc metalloproteinase nas-7 n=1 Tax=Stylonychia lemnae TaxID=5949 RepID=A0A078ATP6_STYLE|nr:zinc metalloproteinase nas-7 [Stylonychia lemnae]|eukprot:CDW84218.1 zinc metalloproteinase nas-7 [Stylonychia lemnae]
MGNICGDNHDLGWDSRSNKNRPNFNMHGMARRWDGGKIYYLNLVNRANEELYFKVEAAIQKWNQWNGENCQWVIASMDTPYCVNFVDAAVPFDPKSSCGCWKKQDQTIQLSKTYQNGQPIRVACILHEMMHTAGFRHGDNYQGITNYNSVPLGANDPYSLMNLGHVVQGNYPNNPEVLSRADSGDIFSKGDLQAIKLLYKYPKQHHGIWHRPCNPNKCTKDFCHCNSCGLMPNGVNCGYTGTMQGHWTCCLNEEQDMHCGNHTGFWHAPCTEYECTDIYCICRNCSTSCFYRGKKGHWSCCLKTEEWAECTQSPYKI